MDHQSSILAVVPMKILIGDDELQVRRVLRRLIEGRRTGPYERKRKTVFKPSTSEQFRPDVIILDLALPELNGFEAAARIAKSLPDVPMLMFTLYVSPQVEKDPAKVGVQRVIAKSSGYHLVPASRRRSGRFITPSSGHDQPRNRWTPKQIEKENKVCSSLHGQFAWAQSWLAPSSYSFFWLVEPLAGCVFR